MFLKNVNDVNPDTVTGSKLKTIEKWIDAEKFKPEKLERRG